MRNKTMVGLYFPRRSCRRSCYLSLLLAATASLRVVPNVRAFTASFSFTTNSATPENNVIVSNNNNNNNNKVYDVVIIGGGSAGLTAAKVASTFGKSTVIIEQARLGGDCTWTGCVPSKSLIAAAKAAHTIRTAHIKFGGGIQAYSSATTAAATTAAATTAAATANQPTIDMKLLKQNIRNKIQHIYDEDDSPDAMAKLGIDTIIGQKAIFLDAQTLSLSSPIIINDNDNNSQTDTTTSLPAPTTTTVRATMGIVVATGASPVEPNDDLIPGLSSGNIPFVMTYEQIFDLEEIPKRLTVVGGGPIGCELAQAFSRLGSEVTLVAETLLKKEEPEVQDILERVFEVEGIKRYKGRITQVEKDSVSGGHIFTYERSDGTTAKDRGDMLLVAVGRKANTAGFGLEEIGVVLNTENGCIQTNDKLQTSVKTIYAAGDCTAEQQFTHYAGFQGGTAARNIVLPFSDRGIKDPDQVPAATYTSPEVSSVGLKEAQAIEQFSKNNVGIAFQKMSHVDRAQCESETEGFIKIIYNKKNYQILGATIMGPSAGEMISEIGVAMYNKMPFDKLSSVTHSYPTYSIAIQIMATDVLYEKTLKMKGILNFLKKLGF